MDSVCVYKLRLRGGTGGGRCDGTAGKGKLADVELLGGDVGGVAVVGENQVLVGVLVTDEALAFCLTPYCAGDIGEAPPLFVLMRLGFGCPPFGFVRFGTRTEGPLCMKP